MTVNGIDISQWQGEFDWAAYRGKIGFGMCKATEGLHTSDAQFVNNWNGMWELSPTLPRFAYHFLHTSEDPIAQAERFVATVKAAGLLPGDNLVCDFEATEDDGSNDHVPPSVAAEQAHTFLTQVNTLAPNHRVLVYTNPAFAEAGNCAGLGSWFLWVADYGVSRPAVPAPWRNWTFWQYGDSPVDLDVFNGDEAQLLSFCRMPKSR